MSDERNPHRAEAPDARRLPVVPFLETLARRRGLVLGLTFGAAIAAAAFSLIAPITYESNLTILPPSSGSPLDVGGGDIQSSLAKLQIGFATIASSDLFADMIESRSVFAYAVDRLDLITAYGLRGADSLRAYTYAFDILGEDTSVRTANNGLILVTTRARTGWFPGAADKLHARRLAAEIGNALAEGLEIVNREKNTNRTRQARLYLEDQLARTETRLTDAGDALVDFQREHLAVDLTEQVRVGIETAGRLEGELLAREVALGVALQSMQPSNPEVQRLQSEIRELRRQIRGLQRGGGPAGAEADTFAWGLDELPDLGRRYAILLRNVKIHEQLYELLTQQLYHARVKETETLPVIQVLDEASIPIYKKSPVVRKITLLAAILGFAVGVVAAHGLEWWSRYAWREHDAAALRRILRRR